MRCPAPPDGGAAAAQFLFGVPPLARHALTSVGGRMADKLGVRWDGTVSAGHVLTLLGMMVPMIVWGARLEGRVNTEEQLRAQLEKRVDSEATARQAFDSDIRAGLRRLDDKITTLLLRQPVGAVRDGEAAR